MSAIILSISVILQLVAAFLSLRLIKITGRWGAWALISAALTLMGVRRSITLFRVLAGDVSLPPDLTAELVGLSISALMIAGVICAGPLFESLATSNQALRRREAQLADAQRTAKLAIIEFDFRDGSVSGSDEFYRRYGFKEIENLPTYETIFDSVHADDRDRVRAVIERIRHAASPEAIEFEYRTVTPRKDEIHIYSVCTAEKDPAGRTIGCRLVSQDITERKRAEDALRKSEALLTETGRMAKVAAGTSIVKRSR